MVRWLASPREFNVTCSIDQITADPLIQSRTFIGTPLIQFLSGRGWKMMEQHLQRPQSLSNSWLSFWEPQSAFGRFQSAKPPKEYNTQPEVVGFCRSYAASSNRFHSCHVAFHLLQIRTISRPCRCHSSLPADGFGAQMFSMFSALRSLWFGFCGVVHFFWPNYSDLTRPHPKWIQMVV